jgi:uncharacterized membrane protein YhfC
MVKMFPMMHPIPMNAVAMGCGAIIIFLTSLLLEETRQVPVQLPTRLSLIYLVLFDTCGVFILFRFVLQRWTASATSYAFVLFPFVTLAGSAWLTGSSLARCCLPAPHWLSAEVTSVLCVWR